MVLGMPYTFGILGRVDFGPPVEVSRDDWLLAGLRGLFFAGIGTLKRRPHRFVKKSCRAEFGRSAHNHLKPAASVVRPEWTHKTSSGHRLPLDRGEDGLAIKEREAPVERAAAVNGSIGATQLTERHVLAIIVL